LNKVGGETIQSGTSVAEFVQLLLGIGIEKGTVKMEVDAFRIAINSSEEGFIFPLIEFM